MKHPLSSLALLLVVACNRTPAPEAAHGASPASSSAAQSPAVAVAAAETPAPKPCKGDSHEAHEGEAHEAHAAPTTPRGKALHDFHEALSPLWHAPKGDARVASTCASAPRLETLASAVEGAFELQEATRGLTASCAKGKGAAFEGAFHRVHEAYHAASAR